MSRRMGSSFTPLSQSSLVHWLSNTDITKIQMGGARTFDGSADYFSKASHADFVIGADSEFWITAWIKAISGANRTILSKHGSAGGNLAWHLFWEHSTNKVKLTVSQTGSDTVVNSVALAAGAWHFAMIYYDKTIDKTYVSVDGSSFTASTLVGGGINDSGAAIELGRRPTGAAYFRGDIARVGFGKLTTGLSDQVGDIRDSLYNSGSSASLADTTSAQQTAWGMKAFWPLAEGAASNNAIDAMGNHDLAATSAPAVTTGPGLDNPLDGDTIQSWTSLDANARAFSQTASAAKPVFKTTTNGINNRPCLLFDGTDDVLSFPATLTSTSGFISAIIRPDDVSGLQAIWSSSDLAVADEYLVLQLNGTKLEIRHIKASATADAVKGDTVIATDTNYVVSALSSGSAWSLFVNGVEQGLTVVSGSNSGDWLGDLSSNDRVSIGAIATTSTINYYDGKIADTIVSQSPDLRDLRVVERYLANLCGVTL